MGGTGIQRGRAEADQSAVGKVVLDPRRLQGTFHSATFQHRWLGATGTPEDTTLLYLVMQGRPDAAFLPEPVIPVVAKARREPRQEDRHMQIKSNTLLKVLVPVVLFIAIAIGVKSCGSGTPPASSTVKTNTVADLTDEELQILGIEGDTPEDTLRTLVARLKVIQDKQASLERQNVTLSEENATLKEGGVNVDNRIRDAVNVAKQEEVQARQKLQAEQQHGNAD